MIGKIKDNIKEQVGKPITFTFNGSRNQVEVFEGTIEEVYNCVFVIRVKENNILRSFSYSDVLVNNLVLGN